MTTSGCKLLLIIALLGATLAGRGESPNLIATYLGNEGVMVAQGGTKIVFDPLYRDTYGTYQAVPEKMRLALLRAQPPFADLQALFISHAHGDHFSASDTAEFLRAHSKAYVIGPAQAIDALVTELKDVKAPVPVARLVRIDLEYGSQPMTLSLGDLQVEVVRIPHAGGAGRRAIQNLLYRVKLAGEAVVMHMGDADPDLRHYRGYDQHWQLRPTDLALPPYWFFAVPGGNSLLVERLNTTRQIGVHVPVEVPAELRDSGADYFSTAGEQRIVESSLTVGVGAPPEER